MRVGVQASYLRQCRGWQKSKLESQLCDFRPKTFGWQQPFSSWNFWERPLAFAQSARYIIHERALFILHRHIASHAIFNWTLTLYIWRRVWFVLLCSKHCCADHSILWKNTTTVDKVCTCRFRYICSNSCRILRPGCVSTALYQIYHIYR